MLPAAAAYDDYYLYEFARESEREREVRREFNSD